MLKNCQVYDAAISGGGGMACGGDVADRPLERCTEAAGKGERGPRGDGSVAMAARVIVFVVVE